MIGKRYCTITELDELPDADALPSVPGRQLGDISASDGRNVF